MRNITAKYLRQAAVQGHIAPQEPRLPGRQITVQVEPGLLPEATDQAEQALVKYESNYYQRSGQLVRWVMSRPETVYGIARPGGNIILVSIDTDYLLDRLNRLVHWQRYHETRKGYVNCHAPRPVATSLLARRGAWLASPLVAVINAPTLRPDGSILDTPGYDAATGLLYVNHHGERYDVPQQPTYGHAQAALGTLKAMIKDFPFAEPHDESAALSAILTGAVRHALRTAPMHTFSAPRMASGKSLLADVVGLVATGAPATVMTFTDDADEMRKRILSVLLQGDLVINIDNIEVPLQSQTLCSVLTQETFTDRLLGVNKTATAPTLCCWLATGNNLQVAGDLTTRVIPCVLDPQCERPEERVFDRNLYEWIPANRPIVVTAALTVLRAYIVAGKPKQELRNFARFEQWSNWVRAALVWLGEADPLIGREQIVDADPVANKLRRLMLAWYPVFGERVVTSKEVVQAAKNEPNEPLADVLEEYFMSDKGAVSSRQLGKFLKKYSKRTELGARFEPVGDYQHMALWKLVIVDKARFQQILASGHPTHQTHENSSAG